ncbi:hypothetical protein TPA0909_22620 [Streptomyces albus]|nr:hypothetical protein TPA0909_22620 [Streptomyces albus]
MRSAAGAEAALIALGEPRAVTTVRRAGAGAGDTCSGMAGRLSWGHTVLAGARTTVSARGWPHERREELTGAGRERQVTASFAQFIRDVFEEGFR